MASSPAVTAADTAVVDVGRESTTIERASSCPQAQSDGPYGSQRFWPLTAGCTRAMGCEGQVDLWRCMGRSPRWEPSSQVCHQPLIFMHNVQVRRIARVSFGVRAHSFRRRACQINHTIHVSHSCDTLYGVLNFEKSGTTVSKGVTTCCGSFKHDSSVTRLVSFPVTDFSPEKKPYSRRTLPQAVVFMESGSMSLFSPLGDRHAHRTLFNLPRDEIDSIREEASRLLQASPASNFSSMPYPPGHLQRLESGTQDFLDVGVRKTVSDGADRGEAPSLNKPRTKLKATAVITYCRSVPM